MQVDERPIAAPQPPNAVPVGPLSPLGQVSPPAGQPHSRLGGAVISLAAIATGLLGIVDLAGAPIHASAYLAVPLATIGVGLLLGAWYGRARWLIAIGAVLTLGLGIATVSEGLRDVGSSTTWSPTSIEQLQGTYTLGVGDAVLDMSALDFTGRSESVEVRLDIGDLTVIVPPTVDVRAEATVDVGNANVFGTGWGGIGNSSRTVTDQGPDGVGGGELVIRASVDVGNVEVRR